MRHFLAVLVLAIAALGLTQPLPAQFNSMQAFPSLSDQSGRQSWLGVVLRDIDVERAKVIKLGDPRGVEVFGVQDDSPAEAAGIHVGDVLLSFNSEPIVGAHQLGRLVAETPPGRKIKIELWREGKVTTVTVTTCAPPSGMGTSEILPGNFPRLSGPWPPSSFPTPLFSWTNPQLGIECEALNSRDSHNAQLADYFGVSQGVLIRSVDKDSPAGKAGLRAGDVLTQIGDRTVADPQQISSYLLREHRSTTPISVQAVRDHKPFSVKINLLVEPQ